MKRGSGHIEMILSFVIFMAALGFALYFFRPGGDRLVESSFSYLFREIEENTSSRVFIYSVIVHNGTFSENHIAFNLSGVDAELNPIVLRENRETIDSRREGELVYANDAEGWNEIDFISIVFSDEFSNGGAEAGVVNENYYEISSSLRKEIMSEGKIRDLKEYYDNNYIELKKDFNIPGRVNFGFELVLDGETIRSEREIPENLEVFIKKKRIEVLRGNGEIEFGELTIKVW